jgi:hypothetical protein
VHHCPAGFPHQKPDLRPRPEMQQILDAALDQAPQAVRNRFATLMGGSTADSNRTARSGAYSGPACRGRSGNGQDPLV